MGNTLLDLHIVIGKNEWFRYYCIDCHEFTDTVKINGVIRRAKKTDNLYYCLSDRRKVYHND